MSVTARTAGFNTIDYGAASDSSNFLTIILMSIEGSPGSTAGGVKTTTIALIVPMAWSRLGGRLHTSIWGRTIDEGRIQGAIGLFALGFTVMTLGIFASFAMKNPGSVVTRAAVGDGRAAEVLTHLASGLEG